MRSDKDCNETQGLNTQEQLNIYIAVFPHGMDVKIVAIENADWLWKTTSHSWWAKKSCL